MKLTAGQKHQLKQYLWTGMTYRETYEEVYDHIITALENKADNIPFQDAVNAIIREDFGGLENLNALESRYRKFIFKELVGKYAGYFTGFLKFPLVCYTAIVFAIVYCIVLKLNTHPLILELVPVSLPYLCLFFIPGRYHNNNLSYLFKSTKKYLRGYIFTKIIWFPLGLCLCSSFLLIMNRKSGYVVSVGFEPALHTVIIVAEVILLVAVFKLRNYELKLTIKPE